ncbi:Cullin-associated NEDD8-dissociated protein 1 [Auxenochlorella protothecoides]|uniref:Cullin-associated NEDD8-dissociated protein 1 n=1 Tax=Auxenochlorella protothecoides TaxID=3075 RepID=A0A087SHJ5_AUXPR|nr:Cullin-associated NEDD8-dissociated protein 1 [Auxenochlorella protothecoides]KFM25199.1 Cullin-associated NEDD8-dissociated protein 1 [Auxenochlorella protothecoides]
MAASDLATELAKEGFRFESPSMEVRVTEAILRQLEDPSGDVSALALKCLGLISGRIGNACLKTVLEKLMAQMVAGKQPGSDDAALGLKTFIQETPASVADEVAVQLVPQLSAAMNGQESAARNNAVDVLLELTTRFPASIPDPSSLKNQLLMQLPVFKKRAVQCLAQLAVSLSQSDLDELAASLYVGGGKAAATALLHLQALAAVCNTIGWRFGRHASHIIDFALEQLDGAGEEEEERLEQSLHTLEAVVLQCSGDAKPAAAAILQATLKYDPNYDEEDSGGEDGDGPSAPSDDEDDDGEDEFSDDEDVSWKVRCAAARLAGSATLKLLAPPEQLYATLAGPLVSRFKEREAVVKSDVLAAYIQLLQQVKAQASSGDTASQQLLQRDLPSVVKALARELGAGGKSAKVKGDVFGVLQELARVDPSTVGAQLPAVLAGVTTALADTSAASASLKLAALQFLTAALTEARGVNAAALLPALPSVLQATLDRYYKVAAAALRAVAAAAPALAGEAPAGAGDDKHDPASPPAPALADAATAVLARLRPVDLDQEVKEGAIAAAAALLAALGDALGLETQAVGELTREFAAMPKARTSKRAKLAQMLELLLERVHGESTATAAIRAFEQVALSSRPLNLTPVLEKLVRDLTQLLKKSSRSLRLAALRTLKALVAREGASLPADVLAGVVAEAGTQLSEAELMHAGLALQLAVVALESQPEAALEAARSKVLPGALTLAASPLLQPSVLTALQSFFARLALASGDAAAFAELRESLMQKGLTAAGAALGGHLALARCVAALCALCATEDERVQGTLQHLLHTLQGGKSEAAARRLALGVLGEIGRGRDLGQLPQVHEALLSALSAEDVADAAATALGGATSGALGARLDPLLGLVRDAAATPRLQYQLFRALAEVLHSEAAEELTPAQRQSVLDLILAAVAEEREESNAVLAGATSGALGARLDPLLGLVRDAAATPRLQYQLFRALAEVLHSEAAEELTPAQRQSVLDLILAAVAEEREESNAVLAECLGTLAALGAGACTAILTQPLQSSSPGLRALALAAARHATVHLGARAAPSMDAVAGPMLACLNDPDLSVRHTAVLLLSSSAHACPALVRPHVAGAQPFLLRLVVNLGPFKHTIDDGLEVRKAAFEALVVLLDACPAVLDMPAVHDALLSGLKDQYDVKVTSHILLTCLAALEPDQTTARLEALVEPLTATLTAKVKADAVKQEVDRNDDLLRSCLRAVAALERLPGCATVAPWTAFISGVVQTPALKVLTTLDGQACDLPNVYNGQVIRRCIDLGDGLYCPVESGQYKLCADQGSSISRWTACNPATQARSGAGDIGQGNIPVVPTRIRKLRDGTVCPLPFVDVDRNVLTDCVAAGGDEVCPSLPGRRACAPQTTARDKAMLAPLMFAPRTTEDGAPCALPFVQGGSIYMDCLTSSVDGGRGNSSAHGFCPTEAALGAGTLTNSSIALSPCSPALASTPLLDFDAGDAFLNRTQPGGLTMMCVLDPRLDEEGWPCQEGLTCLPLEGSTGYAEFNNLGFCSETPLGGVFNSFEPLAFYPLTSAQGLNSLLLPPYTGTARNIEFDLDFDFNQTVKCEKELGSRIKLEPVPYATTGFFAVNLWFAVEPSIPLMGLKWLFSHTDSDMVAIGLPNQVLIFLARSSKTDGPLLVGLISDGKDAVENPDEFVSVQTDGTTFAGPDNGTAIFTTDFLDGGWHMVTLTTEAGTGERGYSLYLDGAFAGSAAWASPNTPPNQLPGGDPTRLSKPIQLCSSIDNDTANVFNGFLAHLSLFPEALTPDAVAALYESYVENSTQN